MFLFLRTETDPDHSDRLPFLCCKELESSKELEFSPRVENLSLFFRILPEILSPHLWGFFFIASGGI